MNQKALTEVFNVFFKHYMTVKMYHFQTKLYGAHKSSDAYLVKFLANMDQFLEVAQGITGQTNIKNFDIKFSTKTDKNILSELDHFADYFVNMKYIEKYPELLAIRDVLVADAQQLKYLLLFK